MSFKLLDKGLAPRVYKKEDVEDIVAAFVDAVNGSQVILAMNYLRDIIDILDQRLTTVEDTISDKQNKTAEASGPSATAKRATSTKKETVDESTKTAESNG